MYEAVSGLCYQSFIQMQLDHWPDLADNSIVTKLIRAVNHFPGIFQGANLRDNASGAPVDVYSLIAIEKGIKQKLILPFIVHSCPKSCDYFPIHQFKCKYWVL